MIIHRLFEGQILLSGSLALVTLFRDLYLRLLMNISLCRCFGQAEAQVQSLRGMLMSVSLQNWSGCCLKPSPSALCTSTYMAQW